MQSAFHLPGTHVLRVDEGLPRFSHVIFSHIVFADKSVAAFLFWANIDTPRQELTCVVGQGTSQGLFSGLALQLCTVCLSACD